MDGNIDMEKQKVMKASDAPSSSPIQQREK